MLIVYAVFMAGNTSYVFCKATMATYLICWCFLHIRLKLARYCFTFATPAFTFVLVRGHGREANFISFFTYVMFALHHWHHAVLIQIFRLQSIWRNALNETRRPCPHLNRSDFGGGDEQSRSYLNDVESWIEAPKILCDLCWTHIRSKRSKVNL